MHHEPQSLWDDNEYQEEYDIDQFVRNLKAV